jgi:hypothetical protein
MLKWSDLRVSANRISNIPEINNTTSCPEIKRKFAASKNILGDFQQ